MNLAPYRQVLSVPGMRFLMIVGFLARIPATAAGMAVTLHVITTLHLEYTEAGIAGAVTMIGAGLGAPVLGRMVDKVGLRPVFAVTIVAQAVYWAIAPSLSYPVLVASAGLAGFASIPIFSVMRQFLSALVPHEHSRTAFALDSMAVELSYMAGPALAVAAVTSLGSPLTLYFVGAGLVAGGTALFVMNPPIRSAEEEEQGTGAPIPRRQWLRPSLITLLAVTAATTLILSATELAVVAVLQKAEVTQWTGLVIALWCVYSLAGGFVYGALHRSLSPLVLTAGLGALTLPLALVGGPWWWLIAALIPCGFLTAPSLASTVDTVSQWVPASARGEAMGLHGAALTCGIAFGAPFAGAVIDNFGPHWGFAAAGATGLLIVGIAIPFWQRAPRPATTSDNEPAPALAKS
jgi:MFS family permease